MSRWWRSAPGSGWRRNKRSRRSEQLSTCADKQHREELQPSPEGRLASPPAEKKKHAEFPLHRVDHGKPRQPAAHLPKQGEEETVGRAK